MSADYAYGNLANGREVNCENGYFMLGDASIDSLDSRYTGVVTKDRFRGRVWCVVAPAERRGFCVKTQTDRSLQAASPSSVWARRYSPTRGPFQDATCLRTRRAIWIQTSSGR